MNSINVFWSVRLKPGIIIFFILSLHAYSFADTLVLTDGSTVNGTIISIESNSYLVRTAIGEISVTMEKVKKVITLEVDAKDRLLTFKNGSKIIGSILKDDIDSYLFSLEGNRLNIKKGSVLKIEDYRNDIITNLPGDYNPTGHVWRSFVFPGWGQVYNNETTKGLLFGAGFITSAIVTLYLKGSFNKESDLYYSGGLRTESQYNKINRLSVSIDLMTFLTLGIYFYNVVDTIF